MRRIGDTLILYLRRNGKGNRSKNGAKTMMLSGSMIVRTSLGRPCDFNSTAWETRLLLIWMKQRKKRGYQMKTWKLSHRIEHTQLTSPIVGKSFTQFNKSNCESIPSKFMGHSSQGSQLLIRDRQCFFWDFVDNIFIEMILRHLYLLWLIGDLANS